MRHDIVILAGESLWTWALANALGAHFGDVPVILEKQQPVGRFWRQRVRRLGLGTVAGQIAFGLFATLLRPRYGRQAKAILIREKLDVTPHHTGIVPVSSVNHDQTIELLQQLMPKVVVISQTRILSRRVLECIPAVFLNVHTGITPQYRGLHGAYWALANGDAGNCGVTVHIVDAGVDTGPIVAQARINPAPADSYFTYHWLQLAAALPLLIHAVADALAGHLVTSKPAGAVSSRQYYHPTLWRYLWTGWRRGVW
jgi:folate-dependent phosphoribosylglycinamide formyltransferase PurN